jgi:hypothetical protein
MCLSDMANSVKYDVKAVIESFGAYVRPDNVDRMYIDNTCLLLIRIREIFETTELDQKDANKERIAKIVKSLKRLERYVKGLSEVDNYAVFIDNINAPIKVITENIRELISDDPEFPLVSFTGLVADILQQLPGKLKDHCNSIFEIYTEFRTVVREAVAAAKLIQPGLSSVSSSYSVPSANARFRSLVVATRAVEDEPIRRSVRWR